MTECNQETFTFAVHFSRRVEAGFTAGQVSSDGGALLLREVEGKINLLGRLAACFSDGRDPDRVEHPLPEMLSQRIYGLALGYEDLNDHEQLRSDPLFGLLSGKRELESPLAGKSTLNRLELIGRTERYHKIGYAAESIDRLLVDLYIESHASAPAEVVLDLDATDIPLYGHQPERFFHGYYDNYCYLPLYIFAGDQLLCARLRPANQDAAAGSVEEVKRIVAQLREHWGEVKIVLRADSGFCREKLMGWCEANEVDYVFGLQRNTRLRKIIGKEMHQAHMLHQTTGKAARLFPEFCYRTHKSWSSSRRVVAKAEYLDKGENPRFIVTSLTAEEWGAQDLYEKFYCARGEMGVSSQGHINQSVKVRPRPIDSSLVAGEAPWRESKTVKPSDNMLGKEYAQPTRLQRAVNADVAS
ncbi:MAG TPA: IS1380 family transposase [Silvibacterium sp.]|nr:IS1380 family transposase [Silvibacterium sp.]